MDRREELAMHLAVAISRIRARLRDEGRTRISGFSLSQISILKRLKDGPTTAANLAGSEHVSHQAISQAVLHLKQMGLVQSVPSSEDRRERLIAVTDKGSELMASILASRDAWLIRAIDATISDDELADLDRAVSLLERLAEVRLGPNVDLK